MRTSYPLHIALMFASLLAGGLPLHAQPAARITSITAYRDAPEARFRLHVLCDSVPYYDLNASMLNLNDNGSPVTDFSIETFASPAAHKDFTAMLVLDRSGSMMGAPISELKAACHEMVTFMDSTADEIGIILFNEQVTYYQSFSSSPHDLRARIDQIPASGATAVWDGAYAGVQLLSGHQGNPSRAVLLMTDGADNSSTKTPDDVISLALQQNIRVFTVGLGTIVQGAQLQRIADTTGGLYFQTPNPADLTAIFMTIASLTRRDFDEYTIRFTSPDPSATQHTLDITVGACGGIASTMTTRPVMDGVSSRNDIPAATDGLIALHPLSPNPVTGGIAMLKFSVPAKAAARDLLVTITDMLGRNTGAARFIAAREGENSMLLDLAGLPPGIYHIRLLAGDSVSGAPLVIAR